MRHQSPSSWAIIAVSIAALVHLALGFSIEFSVDEAHYALYAKYLAWSYFDHPPLVGWVQWPLVSLSSSEGIIRLIPELLWIISAYLVYQLTLEVHHLIQGRNAGYLTTTLPSANLCGLLAVLTIIAAPLPHVLAIGLVPDTLLTPFSLGIMLMTIRWLTKDSLSMLDWAILGILLGLSGLSKYTAAFTVLALLLVFLVNPKKSWIGQMGFWLAALIALLLITPVLYWNWINDWMSFKYQIAHGSGGAWVWRKVGAFIGLQIACFGPLFIVGLYAFLKHCLHSPKVTLIALLGFFFIPFLIFAALSGGGSLPHWTTPAWFCLAPFVGIGLAKTWVMHHRLAIRLLFIGQVLICILGFGFVLSGGINSAAVRSNPIADLYGWKMAGQKAAQLAQSKSVAGIAVQNWTLGSRAAWYAQPLPVFVLDQRKDQFDLWFGELPPGSDALLINWSGMAFTPPIEGSLAFEKCEPLDSLEITRFGQVLTKFDYSLCRNWQKAGTGR
ncbi:glycosyltransferase family 39 protein [Polynucleobacter sp. es-EL-1]|uniref:glycosyltransferase family 39 protein n=1 Tax=Polynucleobacter sp. es-EL-1 TaxID=1855652 RepID=UPI001BFD52F2|nr:glycosyltransferase family 39 protein [Polynucleobacter sp. es-EL-1]QWE09928.1 glycosyltransferase family 39 protein [Polynucleobacter sp. es-EL-1]